MIVEFLNSVDRSTLREKALEVLRAAITAGQYRPGDPLGEVELAEKLGVSRGTVRQALQQLQQEGLVIAGNRSMLRVNNLSALEVKELYRVRAALEGLAVRQLMAAQDVATSVCELREALCKLADADADADADFADRVEADLGFHLRLCRLSGNSMLVEAWQFLEGRFRIVMIGAGPERAPMMMTRIRHEPIVDAIESADAAVAVTVVTEHMTAAADHFAYVIG